MSTMAGSALEHAAQDQEDDDRHGHEREPSAGQARHQRGEALGDAGLGDRPRHCKGSAEDQQDRAREGGRLDEHRLELRQPMPP